MRYLSQLEKFYWLDQTDNSLNFLFTPSNGMYIQNFNNFSHVLWYSDHFVNFLRKSFLWIILIEIELHRLEGWWWFFGNRLFIFRLGEFIQNKLGDSADNLLFDKGENSYQRILNNRWKVLNLLKNFRLIMLKWLLANRWLLGVLHST